MMIGDHVRAVPAVEIPASNYHFFEDLKSRGQFSPVARNVDASLYEKSFTALQRYLPSNKDDAGKEEVGDFCDDFDFPVDAFSCDDFRMFEFKVKKCARARAHDWTECPFVHPGEKARRRDPRRFHYAGSACPDFRNGVCVRGDACEYAHGVFECWLHPARYRTQPCKEGTHCRRRVCFFAHTPDQLRVLPFSAPEESRGRLGCDSPGHPCLSPFGTYSKSATHSPTTESPPMSPNPNTLNQIIKSIRGLHLHKTNTSIMNTSASLPSWGLQIGSGGFGSPRNPPPTGIGYRSLPATPIGAPIRSGQSAFDIWEASGREEPALECVESGRNLREKMYAKLSKENSLDRVDPNTRVPDFGWVSELVS